MARMDASGDFCAMSKGCSPVPHPAMRMLGPRRPVGACFRATEHAQGIDGPARIGIFLVLPHDLDRGAVVDRGERSNRSAILDLFQRLLDLLAQQSGSVIRPLGAEQGFRPGDGVKREIGADRRHQADRNVRPILAASAATAPRSRSARLVSSRGLRENIFVEEALFGRARKKGQGIVVQAPAPSAHRRQGAASACRSPVRKVSSGTPRMMVAPSAQRRNVFSAMAAISAAPNTLVIPDRQAGAVLDPAEALDDRRRLAAETAQDPCRSGRARAPCGNGRRRRRAGPTPGRTRRDCIGRPHPVSFAATAFASVFAASR